LASRIAHHIDFPDFTVDELVGQDDLVRLEPADITVSRVFGTGP
jgi:hypothetical protein